MRRWLPLLLSAFAPAAYAQFQLFVVNGSAELQAPAVFDFGAVSPAQPVNATFRLRNISTASASIYVLSLSGSGFTLLTPPTLPQTVVPQAALDFTIQFQSDGVGAYSAGLTLPGMSVILTATVIPALTWNSPATIDFGPVIRGQSAAVHLVVANRSPIPLTVPPLLVYGDGFSLDNPSPAGVSLQPQQSAEVDLRFAAPAVGAYSGTLTAGDRTFVLAAEGIDPPLPQPLVSVELPLAASAQQGTVHVGLDATAQVGGRGTLTLDFQGAADSAVAFASGGRSIAFTIAPGDTKAIDAAFETGTTAGTLVFTATLGKVTAQQSVAILPAAVSISSAQASRTKGGIAVQVIGFDNSRSAGPLAFTFFDRLGNTIPPAPIAASADFAGFFQSSDLGGLFLLNAAFPVSGDASQIAAFQIQFTNSAGSSSTARTSF